LPHRDTHTHTRHTHTHTGATLRGVSHQSIHRLRPPHIAARTNETRTRARRLATATNTRVNNDRLLQGSLRPQSPGTDTWLLPVQGIADGIALRRRVSRHRIIVGESSKGRRGGFGSSVRSGSVGVERFVLDYLSGELRVSAILGGVREFEFGEWECFSIFVAGGWKAVGEGRSMPSYWAVSFEIGRVVIL